jgi:hypothetical protein
MTTLYRTLYFFTLTLLAVASLQAQQAEAIDYRERADALSMLLEKDEVVSDCDAMSLEVTDTEVYLFYSVGKKLYLRYSLNKGATWQEEFIGFYTHELNESSPLQVVKTQNGYLHLLHFEHSGTEKKLVHRIRTNPSLDWFVQDVYASRESDNNYYGLAAQEDCNANLYVAFHLGEGRVHQATYKSLKWEIISFVAPSKQLGIALTAGFDRKLHIALAENNGDMLLATRYLQDNKFELSKIGESGNPQCAITQTDDGGLLIAGTAFVAGRDKPLQISKMSREGTWEHRILMNSDSANFRWGSYKHLGATVDQSGRIHLTSYLTDYKTDTKKSLCYLFSNDGGQQWFAQTLRHQVYGYPQNNRPHIGFNETHVFVAYKNEQRQPQLLRYNGVNLKGLPACLPRKNPQHTDQVVVKETGSRIVQTPARLPKPRPVPTPGSRKTVTQAEFATRDRFIKLVVWDNKEVDGDTVSIFVNGTCVLHYYGLQSKRHMVEVEIDPSKENQVVLFAETEGTRPPCTASISIHDSKHKQDFVIQSNMKENGAINLRPAR